MTNTSNTLETKGIGSNVAQNITPLQKWIYFCFFLSGMDALIYEVSWLNRIQLIMGHTVYSLSTTLAAYMTGLALGALCVPRLKKTGLSSIALYLGAELCIGLYGLAFYPLLKMTQFPYDWIVSHFQFSLLALSLIQFVFCTVLILIPTFLMGITLPLIGPAIYTHKNEISEKIPTLYAFNTLGAMVGSFAAGYFLLPTLGYSKTSQLAAGINIALYFIVTFFGRDIIAVEGPTGGSVLAILWAIPKSLLSRVARPYSQAKLDLWSLITLYVSGLICMLTQVSWNRLAALGFGPTTYIFSMVTTVVLGGIVIGSWMWRRMNRGEEEAKRFFVLIPLLGSFTLLVGNYIFTLTPKVVLFMNHNVNPEFELRTLLEMSWAFVCLLPAAVFTGALFPAAVSRLTINQGAEEATRSLGVGYAMNIAGLMTGALLGSFVLLPYLGIEWVQLGSVILLFVLSALLAWKTMGLAQSAIAIIVLGCVAISVVPSFNWNLLTSGYFYNRNKNISAETLRESGWLSAAAFLSIRAPLIDRKDDPHATISIHQGKLDKTYRSFKVNGKVDGTNAADLKTTRLLSAFPAMVNANAKNAVIIGLGTGSTAAQTLRFPHMEKVTMIELSSAMVEFAQKYFGSVDGDIWNDSRFSVVQRDGRDFLDHTQETFDLIISEPSNPWVDGVASLFTREFYQSVYDRLTPDGVASLWFHTYGLDCQSVQSVLSAAAAVFPAFLVLNQGGDLFMLGAKQPDGLRLKQLPPELGGLEMVMFRENDVIASSGAGSGVEADLRTAYRQVLSKVFLYDRDEVLNFSFLAPINQDDNQFLQFRSGQTFPTGISCKDFPGSGSMNTLERYMMAL